MDQWIKLKITLRNLCVTPCAWLKLFLNPFWQLITFKWIFSTFGMTTKTVFFRSVCLFLLFSTVITFGVLKPLHYTPQNIIAALVTVEGAVGKDTSFTTSFDLLLKVLAIVGGTLSVIYFAINQEFAEKYSRLCKIFDEDLSEDEPLDEYTPLELGVSEASLGYLGNRHLNFLEDCILCHMEEHRSFSSTTFKTLAALAKIKAKDQTKFTALTEDYPDICQYFRDNWSDEKTMYFKLYKYTKKSEI